MTIDVLLDKGDGYNSIANWVVACDKIPYYLRNRDFSTGNESLNMSISFNCPYVVEIDDKVKITIDSTDVFGGFINKLVTSRDSAVYKIELYHNLQNLEKYIVQYDDLHSLLTANGGDPYKYQAIHWGSPFNCDIPIAGVLHILVKMFLKAGLTLDVSDVENAVAFSYTFNAPDGITDPGYGSTQNVLYKQLFIYENMLYCINQGVAAPHANIDNTVDEHNKKTYAANKITFFEYVQEILSNLSLGLKLVSLDHYKLIFPTGDYTIVDNLCTSYENEIVSAKKTNAIVYWNFYSANLYQSFLADGTGIITDLEFPYWNGDGNGESETINFLNNHKIAFPGYYKGSWNYTFDDNHYDVTCYLIPLADGTVTASINPIENKLNDKIKSYEQERFTTAIDLTLKTVRSHYLDLTNVQSIITQETAF